MKFLLFLLGFIFFFIFYLFSHISGVNGFFIPNLFVTANIYISITVVIIGILFIHHKAPTLGKNDDVYGDEDKKRYLPTTSELISFIRDIFSYYIYYIACGLFYLALYFILKSFYKEASLPLVFVFINSIVVCLYFLEHKFRVFQDFVKVNLLLISLYYIIIHTGYLLGFGYEFHVFDIINIAGVFLLFGIILSSQNSEKYGEIMTHYSIAFTFLEIATLYQILFSGEILSLGFIAGILGIIFLVFTSKIGELLYFKKAVIRFWGLMFLGIFILVSLFHIGREDVYVLLLIPCVFVSSYLLYGFHKQFQNYGALTLSLLGSMGSIYALYSILLSAKVEEQYLFLLCFFFSICILTLDGLQKRISLHDRYFLHSLSLLVNLLGAFYFFYFRDFSILSLGILLLGESLYLFFSYYTLKK